MAQEIKVLRDCRAEGQHFPRGKVLTIGDDITPETANILTNLSIAERILEQTLPDPGTFALKVAKAANPETEIPDKQELTK